MEAAKKKEIESRLHQLMAQASDRTEKKKPRPKVSSVGVSVIRRRKGKPDLYMP